MPLDRDEDIARLLNATQRIAVIGASPKPDRASNGVTAALIRHGYEVIPVNPGHVGAQIHGAAVVASLVDIDPPVDLVDIFRNSEDAGAAVDEAIAHGAKAVWMQLGVINQAAAERAEAAGLEVVMDRCPKIELPRLRVAPKS